MNDEIRLAAYETWPDRFEMERDTILSAFAAPVAYREAYTDGKTSFIDRIAGERP